jgi:transposase-like protein
MSEGHAALLYCPYCGEEDLRPHAGPVGADPSSAAHGAWECRSCARVFSVKLLGLSTVALEVQR